MYRTSGCGIVGAVGCDVSAETLERMTDTLAHRGPDARGTWVSPDGSVRLGHVDSPSSGWTSGACNR
jgi:asparagine synthetase B (glutamine-hydrolysing)